MSEPDYVYTKGIVFEELVIIEDGRFTEAGKLYFETERLARRLEMVVRKVGTKFKVFSKDGKLLGTHDTRAAALRQLAAIEATKQRRTKRGPRKSSGRG